MTLALLSSILSAVCMALMVITDQLMVGDCYQGRANQAWFVSSLAGSLLGLVLTAIVWIGAVYLGKVDSIDTLLTTAVHFAAGRGPIMIFVGALGVQILLHYFRCFGEKAHSVAAWLASTPIFVFVVMLVLTLFVDIKGLSTTSIDPIWIIGVLLGTAGLVCFERLAGDEAGGASPYPKELLLMLCFNVLYTISLRQVLGLSQGSPSEMVEVLALMPYYWIGFAAGTRVIFKKGEWQAFQSNWRRRARHFIVPILFVEMVGMLVFYFEYLGLTELDPAYVSIITGAHVFLVYILSLALGHLRLWMREHGIQKIYVGGIRLLERKLPHPNTEPKRVALEVATMGITVIGIVLASVSVHPIF